MVKVYSPEGRSGSSSAVLPAVLVLVLTMVLLAPRASNGQAQPPGATSASPPAAQEKGTTKGEPAKAKDAAPATAKKDQEATPETPPDPSQSLKTAPVEVFNDPNAEALLDVKKFNPIRNPAAPRQIISQVKEMAASPSTPVDAAAIRQFVLGMVTELTDTRNIQALIDPPAGLPNSSPTMQAIQNATANLLEPLFVARANKSTQFLAEYNRALATNLTPLLKHHLVPRIQAMIVLGQSANPDLFKVFLDELKNDKQTIWVQLWAIRGLTNIVRLNATPRLNANQTSQAAGAIATFLDTHKELPWPVQLRGLEALAFLRQGFLPTSPKSADMAVTAMRFLADTKGRPDVRAEAARSLGFMQITNAVPAFNFSLIAYAATELAAKVGDQVVASYTENGPAINATRAEYLTSLLVGPVHQAFDGHPELRDSGLLHNSSTVALNSRPEIQKYLAQIEPVSKAALELIRSPAGQLKARRQDLVDRVAALKDFLTKNGPKNTHLVPDDPGFPQVTGSAGQESAAPTASAAAGTSGGK